MPSSFRLSLLPLYAVPSHLSEFTLAKADARDVGSDTSSALILSFKLQCLLSDDGFVCMFGLSMSAGENDESLFVTDGGFGTALTGVDSESRPDRISDKQNL